MTSSLDQAWNLITKTPSWFGQADFNKKEVDEAIRIISINGLLQISQEWYLSSFRDHILTNICPSFWAHFKKASEDETEPCSLFQVFDAFKYLHTSCGLWLDNQLIRGLFVNQCDTLDDFRKKMKYLIKSLLFFKIEQIFNAYILTVYTYGFKVSKSLNPFSLDENSDKDESQEMDSSGNLEGECMICKEILSSVDSSSYKDMILSTDENRMDDGDDDRTCHCQFIMKLFIEMNDALRDLDLLDEISGDAVASVIHNHIEAYVIEKCKKSFEESFLKKLEVWIRNVIFKWRRLVFGDNQALITKASDERLMHFMHETYAQMRTSQMFDIIIEYPDSEPALEDLKECLGKCHGTRTKVINSIKDSFEARLLHPGVTTNDILTAYIQTIKALKVLDPSGVILEIVCDPIKKYLKSREDTVRCIITALTDESSELVPELAKDVSQTIDDVATMTDDELIGKNWKSWKPDPVDAGSLGRSKSVRQFDIVSILVNVYESKDLFVEEYQRLLAQRFLHNFECNVDHERRNLELLTLRFGESDLHSCEVMLQDISSSKRIDNRINAGEIEAHHWTHFPIKCLILSAQFWPDKLGLNPNEEANKLKLPPPVQESIKTYTQAFETIKGSRTLNWLPPLGSVDLELDFGSPDKKQSFTVSPIHAAIIWQFQEKESWNLSELSQSLSVSTALLRRKISFWQNKGIIRELSGDRFVLIDNQTQSCIAQSEFLLSESDDDEDYEDESLQESNNAGSASGQDVGENKHKVYWQFIENMLTNLNSLSLERIRSMFNMFACPNGSSEQPLTIQQLRNFLETKVKEHKLVFSNGQYRLA
ncbi:anaphase-promoting complex subunit 2-like [Tetranychus urticae]|uniref:Anaphase-promoting complex subunit 2 n=1 Tax=Tetranychus urticae TaxID=32264 RepID=T1JXC4_TETUR|nr:anaphase-promoting complex subunit 2-like [Tetranychus urticae]